MRFVPCGTRIAALLAVLLFAFGAQAQQQPASTTPQGWLRVGALATLAPNNSSANVELGWALASPPVKPPPLALVCNTGSTNAYVQLGTTSAVQASTTAGSIVVNGQCRLLALNGNSWIAGITASSSTTMTIETGSGTPTARNRGGSGSTPQVQFVLGTGTSATDCLGTGTGATDCLGVQ